MNRKLVTYARNLRGKFPTKTSLALAAAMSLVIGATTAPMAHAASDLSNQLITNATLSRTGERTAPLRAGDSVTVNLDWAANGTPVNEGDYIQISLPSWAEFPSNSVSMNTSGGAKVADCVQGGGNVKCTFSGSALQDLGNLRGGFNTTLQLKETKRIEPTTFTIGPSSVSIAMLAEQNVINEGILPGQDFSQGRYPIDEMNRKEGHFFGVTGQSAGKALVRWDIYVGGIDGTITITDQLAKPQVASTHDEYSFPNGVRVLKRVKSAEGGAGGNWIPQNEGGTSFVLGQNEYSVNWTEGSASNDVTVTIPGAIADKYYLVQIFTQMPADAVPDGTKFENTAIANNERLVHELSAQNMIGAWAAGDPSKGDIYIYKSVTAKPGATTIPEAANQSFTIEASWEDGGQQKQKTLTIPVLKGDNANTAVGKLEGLTPGTKVTLREVAPANGTGTAGAYNWTATTIREGKYGTLSGKNFQPNGDRSVIVTAEKGKRIEVNFNNSYDNTAANPKVSVGDYVWFDSNKDGKQDAGEEGINDVTVTLSRTDGQPVVDADGAPIKPKTTGDNPKEPGKKGYYIFDNLPVLPGDHKYEVTVTTPQGYAPTKSKIDGNDQDSDNPKATADVLTQDGAHDPKLDFGFIKTPKVSVGDYVWFDSNKDGKQDAGEEGINDVTVTLSRTDNQPVKDVTGGDVAPKTTGDNPKEPGKKGYYIFDNLPILPGDAKYEVTVTTPQGFEPTKSKIDANDQDSDNPKATADALTQDDAHDPKLDFGFIKPSVSVGDYVWFDSNKDGIQDVGEAGINGVTVTLSRTDNQPVKDVMGGDVQPKETANHPTEQGKTGYYIFDNLPILPDSVKYEVTVTTPQGFAPTKSNIGANDKDSDNPKATADALTQDGAHDPKLDFGFIQPKVSVGDYVWWDENRDGIQGDNEKGIEGVTLTLSRTDGQAVADVAGVPVATTKTNQDGFYEFANLPVLPEGVMYEVTVTTPAGYEKTLSNQGANDKDSDNPKATARVLPNDEDRDPTLDFGFIKKSVAVGDYVWFDSDRDGIQDDSEKGIEGVTLTISRTDNQPVMNVEGKTVTTTTTNDQGLYKFDKLPVLPDGVQYVVTVTPKDGFVPTLSNQGGNNEKDSDNPKATARVLPNDGDEDLTLDFGFIAPKVSVGDYVWFDEDKDGIQGDGEEGLNDFTLTISRSDEKPVEFVVENGETTTTTITKDGKKGYYIFDNLKVLPEGVFYEVTVSPKRGYTPTKSQQGTDRAKDSDNPKATAVALPNHNDHDPNLDFGFILSKVSVGDLVWWDKDRDGVQDADEKGIQGVTVTIGRSDGQPVVNVNGETVTTTTTNENGFYEFTDLPVLPEGATYTVTVTNPEGYKPTESQQGDDRGKDSDNPTATARDLPNDGDRDPNLDFGFVKPSVSVGDYVWFDENKDGLQDATDKPLKGVELALVGPDGQPVTNVFGDVVGIATTDDKGFYEFKDLPVLKDGQSYTVKVKDPENYVPTITGAGERDKDSSTGEASSQGLTQDGDKDMTLDFGYVKSKVSVGDYVWFDINRDGDQDDDEPGIEGIELKITDNEGNPVKDINGKEVPNTFTDKDGGYTFNELPPLGEGKHYVVTIVKVPGDYLPTKPNAVEDPEKDSSTGSAKTYKPLDKDGDRDSSLDFGFVRPMGKLEIAKQVEGISGFLFERKKDFQVEATWKQGEKVESQTITVRHGEVNTELPEMFAGTEVTLREVLPANNLWSEWRAPTFDLKVPGAVVNEDKSVTFVIPGHTDAAEPVKAVAVGIKNVAHPPLPWILVPLIPLVIKPPAPNHPVPPAQVPPAPPAPAPSTTPTPTPMPTPAPKGMVKSDPAKPAAAAKQEAPAKKGLANTGASVWAIGALALLLMLLGAYLALRSRKA